jgi:hypothetical protein
VREAGANDLRREKNPCPVFDMGSSILRGLFHPDVHKVANPYCAAVSGILNLNELVEVSCAECSILGCVRTCSPANTASPQGDRWERSWRQLQNPVIWMVQVRQARSARWV